MTTTLLDLLIRALALLALAGVATIVLRRRSASLRATVWTLAFSSLLLLPLLSVFAPEWRIPVWRIDAPSIGTAPALNGTGSTLQVRSAEAADDSTSGHKTATPAGAVVGVDAPSSPETLAMASPATVAGGEPRPATSALGTLIVAAMLLMSGALALRLAASHRRLRQICLTGEPLPRSDRWDGLIGDARARLGITSDVGVRITPEVSVPAVAGLRRPVLLLPVDASDWPADVRRMVVLHELAHVARRDGIAQLIAQLACALYWFVPFVWQGARAAAALRERASDDLVLSAGVRASSYADSLLRLAERASGAELQQAALAMARPGAVRERVVAILDPRARRNSITWPARLLLAGMTTAGLGLVSSVVLTATPDRGDADAVTATTSDLLLPLGLTPTQPPAPSRPAITAPPSVSARPPLPQAGSQLCPGEVNRTSQSNTGADGRRRWTLRVSGRDCRIDVETDGRFEFNPEFTDIVRIADGGFVRIDVTTGGTRRELRLEPRGSTLARTWRVDGRDVPYDDAARAWFASFLIELDRQTGVGADVRLPVLLRQGGVDAVLDETALMPSDYVRGEYYRRLAAARRLSAPELTRLIDQAAAVTKSDYYASTLLGALAKTGLDGPARLSAARLIDTMESDHYRAESIEMLLASGPVGREELDLLVRLIPGIESDYYHERVLTHILTRGGVEAARTAALIRLVDGLQSDHYAAAFLKRAARTELSAEARQAYVDATATIASDHNLADALTALLAAPGTTAANVAAVLQASRTLESDHYHQAVLRRVLAVSDLAERELLAVVDASRRLESDHTQSSVLSDVARHRAATDAVRTAVLDAAAAGLSRHYADQVRRAAGR